MQLRSGPAYGRPNARGLVLRITGCQRHVCIMDRVVIAVSSRPVRAPTSAGIMIDSLDADTSLWCATQAAVRLSGILRDVALPPTLK